MELLTRRTPQLRSALSSGGSITLPLTEESCLGCFLENGELFNHATAFSNQRLSDIMATIDMGWNYRMDMKEQVPDPILNFETPFIWPESLNTSLEGEPDTAYRTGKNLCGLGISCKIIEPTY